MSLIIEHSISLIELHYYK